MKLLIAAIGVTGFLLAFMAVFEVRRGALHPYPVF
jgi:hypothetical protein